MSHIDFKVKINDTEHSRAVQDVMFSMGYLWGSSEQAKYEHIDKAYLFAEDDMRIRYANELRSNPTKDAPLYELNSILAPIPVPTVAVASGKYTAKELRQMLKELES